VRITPGEIPRIYREGGLNKNKEKSHQEADIKKNEALWGEGWIPGHEFDLKVLQGSEKRAMWDRRRIWKRVRKRRKKVLGRKKEGQSESHMYSAMQYVLKGVIEGNGGGQTQAGAETSKETKKREYEGLPQSAS